MVNHQNNLKLGKGVAFVKSHLRRLPQSNEVWETDFLQVVGARNNHAPTWAGLVVSRDGLLLNERTVEESPTVNDMARLLADAMRRPMDEQSRRPQTI